MLGCSARLVRAAPAAPTHVFLHQPWTPTTSPGCGAYTYVRAVARTPCARRARPARRRAARSPASTPAAAGWLDADGAMDYRSARGPGALPAGGADRVQRRRSPVRGVEVDEPAAAGRGREDVRARSAPQAVAAAAAAQQVVAAATGEPVTATAAEEQIHPGAAAEPVAPGGADAQPDPRLGVAEPEAERRAPQPSLTADRHRALRAGAAEGEADPRARGRAGELRRGRVAIGVGDPHAQQGVAAGSGRPAGRSSGAGSSTPPPGGGAGGASDGGDAHRDRAAHRVAPVRERVAEAVRARRSRRAGCSGRAARRPGRRSRPAPSARRPRRRPRPWRGSGRSRRGRSRSPGPRSSRPRRRPPAAP